MGFKSRGAKMSEVLLQNSIKQAASKWCENVGIRRNDKHTTGFQIW